LLETFWQGSAGLPLLETFWQGSFGLPLLETFWQGSAGLPLLETFWQGFARPSLPPFLLLPFSFWQGMGIFLFFLEASKASAILAASSWASSACFFMEAAFLAAALAWASKASACPAAASRSLS
jgi:hypothetical protein